MLCGPREYSRSQTPPFIRVRWATRMSGRAWEVPSSNGNLADENGAAMTISPELGPSTDRAVRTAPGPGVRWAIALAGCAAGASSLALVLTSDAVSGDVGEPLVIALLSSWITIAYVLCGL